MFHEPLHAALYMERRPLTEEWLHGLLFRLWEHGLHYNYDYAVAPLTWDEELQVLAHGVAGDEVYHSVPLNELIQHTVDAGVGLITVYDKTMALDLFVDPSGVPDRFDDLEGLDDFPKRFGQVGFAINGPYLGTDDQLPLSRELPLGAYLLAPYQQVMAAGAHWMEVLCEECHPIFGVGSDANRESADDDEREIIEAPLYEGRLPDETAWCSLTYISKRFINDDFILSQLTSPNLWLKRMKDGGILMYTPYNEYAYENAEAYRHEHEGKAVLEQHEFTLATQQYQRAWGIFHSVSNRWGERGCELDIASVDLERRIEKGEFEKEQTTLFATENGTETSEAKGMGLVPLSIIIPFLEWISAYHPEIRSLGKLSDSDIACYLHEFELGTGIKDKHLVND